MLWQLVSVMKPSNLRCISSVIIMFSDQNDYNVQYLNLNLNVIIRNNITISFMVHQILLSYSFGDLFQIRCLATFIFSSFSSLQGWIIKEAFGKLKLEHVVIGNGQ